jgi:NAD+ kinase
MRVLLYGKDAELLQPQLVEAGLELATDDPEVVVSFGGDGTLLHAERAYPGIPKLPVRNSKICKLCSNIPNESIFERLRAGNYRIGKVLKLQTYLHGRSDWALNDAIVTQAIPTHAIRFTIEINRKPYAQGKEIVGDGIIVATPFGSGAYYRSITDGTFSTGIGLAFNNSTEQVDHIVLKESDVVRCTLTRGDAQFAVDTQVMIPLAIGESVEITASKQEYAHIVSFDEEFIYWNSQ